MRQPGQFMRGMGAVEEPLITDFYVYSVSFASLSNGTSQTGQIQIEADSDFEIVKTTMGAWDSNDAEVAAPMVNVLLTDTGSGRQLMNLTLPAVNMFGNGRLPFILPKPKYLFARSILAVTVTNFAAAADYSALYLSFIGRKIFSTGG